MILATLFLATGLQLPDDLQPTTRASPSGRWELFVDPSARDGAGSSRCRSSRDGQLAWERELPFTFQGAVINDRGVAAGYGFTGGLPRYEPNGDFIVAILSTQGEIVFEERVELKVGTRWSLHEPPEPSVRGLLLQPQLDRFVLWTRDLGWWSYGLADPGQVVKASPDGTIEDLRQGSWCVAGHAVPGTPLVVSQWYRLDDAHFAVLDEDLDEVWGLVLPGDYLRQGDVDPFYEIRDEGAILSTGERSFDLRFYREGQRVTYAVVADPEAQHGWSVTEVARVPYASDAEPVVLPEVQDLELDLLATIPLETGVDEPSAVRDVLAFDVSRSGEIRLVRDEGGSVTQVRLGPEGDVLEELPFDAEPLGVDGRFLWAPAPEESWILAASPWGWSEAATLWRYDGRTGRATRLPVEGLGTVEQMAAFPGGVVVGCSWLQSNYPWSTLACIDFEGRTVWTVNHEEKAQDLSIDGLAVHESGRCATVASVFKDLRVFGPAGTREAVFDLEEVLPEPPNFPSGIQTDLDGGWLVHDFNGSPSVWRLSADGSVIRGFAPHTADGREQSGLARLLRREEDGQLWTSDGTTLYRLDEEGAVDRTVGANPTASALTEPARAQIDRLGRVLVQDKRTGAIHVFDGSGVRVALVELPDEQEVLAWGRFIAVRDDGSLLVQANEGLLEYGPGGTLRGPVQMAIHRPRFQPGLGTAWGILDDKLTRVGPDGSTLCTLDRLPDGRWMPRVSPAVGPDGSLVLHAATRGDDFSQLVRYDAEGQHQTTMRIPLEAKGKPIVHGDRAVLEHFGPTVHLVDLDRGSLHRVSIDREGEEEAQWSYGIARSGSELWAVSLKTLTLYRFRMPDRE